MRRLIPRNQTIHRVLPFCIASILLHAVIFASCAPTFVVLKDQRKGAVARIPTVKSLPLVVQLVSSDDNFDTWSDKQKHSADEATPFISQPVSAQTLTTSVDGANANRPASVKPPMSSESASTPVLFHPSIDLTKKPELIGGAPEIVEIPLENSSSGYVIFRLSIDRHGIVKSIRTLHSSLAREVEAELVVPLYRATYHPGEINGIAVDGELDMLFEVHPS